MASGVDLWANRALGMGEAPGVSDYKASFKEWKDQAGQWSDRWGRVADFQNEDGTRSATGQRFDELSNLYLGDVDREAAKTGQQTAASYSRRGMSDSGYAAGSQSDLMLKAAQARASAREAARAAAVGERMNILGQQSSISLDPYKAFSEAATQRYINNENNAAKGAQSGLGSILGLAGGALAAFSDARLKRNIRRLNIEARPGVPFASWEWLDGSPGFGVIAQDLEPIAPELVLRHPSGFLMVNYGGL